MPTVALLVLTATENEQVIPSGLETRDWVEAGIVFAAAIIVGWILQAAIQRVASRGDAELPLVALLARTVRNLVVMAGFLAALASLSVQLGPLLGALGIGGLAVAFAARAILENVFASVVLRTRRPIRRGDEISAVDHDGTVEDINLRVVTLRSFDGERTFLPCAEVLRGPIVNHTVNGLRRTVLPVGIAYDADLDEATGALEAAVAAVEGVLAVPPAAVFVECFGESSVNFALHFWHHPGDAAEWQVRSAVARSVKRHLDSAGIAIPFPQRTLGFLDPEVSRGLSELGRPGR